MQAPESIARGDVVVYNGRLYYFQPKGTESKKRGSPRKSSVRKANPEEVRNGLQPRSLFPTTGVPLATPTGVPRQA